MIKWSQKVLYTYTNDSSEPVNMLFRVKSPSLFEPHFPFEFVKLEYVLFRVSYIDLKTTIVRKCGTYLLNDHTFISISF